MAVQEMHFQVCVLHWIAALEIALKYRFLSEATIATKESKEKEKKTCKATCSWKMLF